MEKPSYYAIIPAFVRYSDITPNAKLLYGEITCLCNKSGICFASNDYFSKLYDVSHKTISVWISELIKKGFIKSELIYRKGTKEVEKRNIIICNHVEIETINTKKEDTSETQKKSKNNFTIPEKYSEFTEVWEYWRKYKKEEHNESYKSEITETSAFNKLIRYSSGNLNKAEKIVELAISNGYKGFFELRDDFEKKSLKTAKNDKFTMEEVLLEKIGNMDTKAEGFDMFQVLK